MSGRVHPSIGLQRASFVSSVAQQLLHVHMEAAQSNAAVGA